MELTLTSSVQYIPRVGPKMAKKLEKLGVKTVEDILWYVPFRYNDFSLVSPIARVQPGEIVTVRGEVVSMKNAFTKTGKRLQQAKVSDETGTLDVIWFNQMYLTNIIKAGQVISLSGKVDWFGHTIVMSSPEYEIFREQTTENSKQGLHTGRLVPVYPETAGVSSKWLRGRIAYSLEHCMSQIQEFLPSDIQGRYGLLNLKDAVQSVHFPAGSALAQRSRYRLAFDELFLLQLSALEQKRIWQTTKRAYSITLKASEREAFLQKLPFTLTDDQKKATDEILADLEKPVPMHRLLEGDVGSGKTVVAATAIYAAVLRGFKAILMAPTQILAQQHYQTISTLFTPHNISVDLITGSNRTLTGSDPVKNADVLVGTHALLSKAHHFKNVGLVVIDEQQRFGVEQRSVLTEKEKRDYTPHLLTMTATPIPRTVAQTIYGNLDLSVLTQMPNGKRVVKTWVVPKEKREKAYVWIKEQLGKTGGQAFIVCPFIEQSETLTSVKSVKAEYGQLKTVFSPIKLGLLHGRMKAKEKSEALERFRTQKDAILLATPVVEVGIDVPNAMIIIVEAAERFGLAQLHQLRGRVGRGRIASFCLLFTEQNDEVTMKRLMSMETIHNGPELSELDLTLRGPGELFGTKQHGALALKIAHFNDKETIAKTRVSALTLTHSDPGLTNFPLLREKIKQSKIVATQD